MAQEMLPFSELHHAEVLPQIRNEVTTSTEPTKLNRVSLALPEETQEIIDLVVLSTGFFLNFSLFVLLLANVRSWTSNNWYVLSFIASDTLLLVEPTRNVSRFIFNAKFLVNLDYVFHVSFDSTVLTIVLFAIKCYIGVCNERHELLHESFTKNTINARRILLVWLTSITTTAMELHLYEHFEVHVMYHVFAASTIFFLILPMVILVLVHGAIVYELAVLKSIEGSCRREDVDDFRLLLSLTIGFLFTMTPYRLAKALLLLDPIKPSLCCTTVAMEILYFLVKLSPLLFPVICVSVCAKCREMLRVLCRFYGER